MALLSLAVASLALGITQGDDWGWSSARVLGALAAAVALGVTAVRRARVHPAPAIDLSLFQNRTVALANAATVAYAVGFFAMLLANVLFLTTVWDWSTLKAGLAITPGPLVVALLSRSTGKLAGRVGYGPVLVVGSLVFAASMLWSVFLMPLEPDYFGRWLPASLLTGLGVALTFPVLSAAAVAASRPSASASAAPSTRPPARWAPCSASRCWSRSSARPARPVRRSTPSSRPGSWPRARPWCRRRSPAACAGSEAVVPAPTVVAPEPVTA